MCACSPSGPRVSLLASASNGGGPAKRWMTEACAAVLGVRSGSIIGWLAAGSARCDHGIDLAEKVD